MIKKLLISIFFLIVTVLFLSREATRISASESINADNCSLSSDGSSESSFCNAPGVTVIAGKVRDAGGKPIGGADVTISCKGHVKNTVTGPRGNYITAYIRNKCGPGDTVTVAATKDGQTAQGSGVVGTGGRANIELVIINVSVPEFSQILAIVAVATSVVLFTTLRKRSLAYRLK